MIYIHLRNFFSCFVTTYSYTIVKNIRWIIFLLLYFHWKRLHSWLQQLFVFNDDTSSNAWCSMDVAVFSRPSILGGSSLVLSSGWPCKALSMLVWASLVLSPLLLVWFCIERDLLCWVFWALPLVVVFSNLLLVLGLDACSLILSRQSRLTFSWLSLLPPWKNSLLMLMIPTAIGIVRTYVELVWTYVIVNWLILWQNALYLYSGRSRMCLVLQGTRVQV